MGSKREGDPPLVGGYVKNNRLHLVPPHYELKGMKAHKAEAETSLAKSWSIFFFKWLNYE